MTGTFSDGLLDDMPVSIHDLRIEASHTEDVTQMLTIRLNLLVDFSS